MAIARSRLIDLSVTRWYHCITRCARRAHLLDEGTSDRREWLEKRIEELAQIFAVGVGGFSVLGNHLHLLLRIEPDVAAGWLDEEVVQSWGRLFPSRDKALRVLPVTAEWIKQRLDDPQWIATTRCRLQNVGWFMKCLKEPLARLAIREDEATGAFFEGRYKSIGILDEEALLAVCAYIDLNPVAAGIEPALESSAYTSIKQRDENVEDRGRIADLAVAQAGSVAGSVAEAGLEESLWLCPIEDRRGLDSGREGMLAGFSLGSYFLLVDYTGRLFRDGKAAISAQLAGVFNRLEVSAERWTSRLEAFRNGRLLGRFFAGSRARLQELAGKLRVRHLVNLAGCRA